MAAFPDTLMFQKMYAKDEMGDPIHLNSMNIVFLKGEPAPNGAFTSIANMGITHVRIVPEAFDHG
jgi:hypothetical protein